MGFWSDLKETAKEAERQIQEKKRQEEEYNKHFCDEELQRYFAFAEKNEWLMIEDASYKAYNEDMDIRRKVSFLTAQGGIVILKCYLEGIFVTTESAEDKRRRINEEIRDV